MTGAWPLTGRDAELALVGSVLRREGGPRGVVLAGAAGVGKTRLAEEALATAARPGHVVRRGRASDSARRLPLGAFGDLAGTVEARPLRLVTQAVELLLGGAALVAVDDAHLLDPLSAAVVHQVAARRLAHVLVTVRTGADAPDAVTALWKDGHLERVELQPLSRPESIALVETVLGGPIDDGSAARLWHLTRGNVLFLRQIVEGELEAGRLREESGLWHWQGELQPSSSLIELIGARMGRLPGPIAELVDILALGEPLDVTLLSTLVDQAALEEAEARGLIHVVPEAGDFQTRLAHPLYGEVRRRRLGVLRARRLRGQVAAALADRDRAEDVLRRAVLTLEADLPGDAALFGTAARSALRLLDFSLAASLLESATRAGGGFDDRLLLANTLSWVHRGEDAEQELATLTELADSDARRARVAIARVGNLFWTLGRRDAAERVLRTARTTIAQSGPRAELSAMTSALNASLGRLTEAVSAGREATADGTLSEQPLLLASWGLITGLGLQGKIDELDDLSARAYAVATNSLDATMLRFGLMDFHLVVLRLAGRVQDAMALAETARRDSADARGQARMRGVALLGLALLTHGQLDDAVRALREARTTAVALGTRSWSFRAGLTLVEALALRGDAHEARQVLGELRPAGYPGGAFLDSEFALARAWVAAAEGAVSEAVTLARSAAGLAETRGAGASEVFALQAAAALGDRTCAPRLAELREFVQGPRVGAAYTQAVGLADGDGDVMLRASAQFEQMGDLLAAAEAAAQAAAALRRAGRAGSAHLAAARADRLANVCQGARTPALIASARPLPLTRREQEIVGLAALGLSNRAIADRLVLSVRTVEGHLYRAGAKLGLKDRNEFAAVILPPGPMG